MRIRDHLFQQAFARLSVYNILFEDTEVDEQFLGLDETSRILCISGAGCGTAGMMSARPVSIDAVDINPHHLALTALKTTASQHLTSFESFYRLFAQGNHPNPRNALRDVMELLPAWIHRYWKKRYHFFSTSLHGQGLTATMLRFVREQAGIDSSWLRWLIHLPYDDRVRAVNAYLAPVLNRPLVKAFVDSPLQLLSLGINYEQRDRLLNAECMRLPEFFLST